MLSDIYGYVNVYTYTPVHDTRTHSVFRYSCMSLRALVVTLTAAAVCSSAGCVGSTAPHFARSLRLRGGSEQAQHVLEDEDLTDANIRKHLNDSHYEYETGVGGPGFRSKLPGEYIAMSRRG